MKAIRCYNCDKTYSAAADTCPHCGVLPINPVAALSNGFAKVNRKMHDIVDQATRRCTNFTGALA